MKSTQFLTITRQKSPVPWYDDLPEESRRHRHVCPAHYLDLSVTATAITPGVGALINSSSLAGATVTAGQVVYLDATATPPNWKPANALTSAAVAKAVGVTLTGGSTGQPVFVLTQGLLVGGFTAVVGGVYVVSGNNSGGIAPSADLATGWFVGILGIATLAGTININIAISGIAHA